MEMPNQRMQKLLEMYEQEPDDLFLGYAIAMEYLGIKEMDKAEEQFRKILLLDETHIPSYYQLGQLLASKGTDFEDEAAVFYERGMALAKAKKDNKTANEFRSALDEMQY